MTNSTDSQQTAGSAKAATNSDAAAGKVWFITGSSTGFGRELAEEALKAGERVIATARKPEQVADLVRQYPATARALALDVTDAKQVEAAAKEAIAIFGRIDVVVNNAGYGVAGAVEEVTEAEFLPMFQTNVFGLFRVTRAFLPQLRAQRSGHIINLSSIGGLIGGPGWGYYNATKFAVEGFSEALAAELTPLGIKVTLVEPGPFRTDFLGRSAQLAKRTIPDYDGTAGKTRAYFKELQGKQRGDPRRAAQAILQAAASDHPPLHLLLGALAYHRYQTKLQQLREEMTAWESVSLGADFPEGE